VVDYAGSSALLVRAASWDAVGGMNDELYAAYYVDADLATAIRAHGEAVLYEPSARERHARGAGSSDRMRTDATLRNRERFRAKWGDIVAVVVGVPRMAGQVAVRLAVERRPARQNALRRRSAASVGSAPSRTRLGASSSSSRRIHSAEHWWRIQAM
jgi:GT2 family glycosyltransferase